ncbi:inner membrane metabolite transport protein ydjE [Anopheles sinensis]|uniref:Inner membrane metabolite transport protein ydjE n=1 Tax=Anopheles sinensis TaxID=74873 RepID=A0A084WS17_ANOSI|nr:inner membrane metabolite transport protein ydjE [Anopheles sinensis]
MLRARVWLGCLVRVGFSTRFGYAEGGGLSCHRMLKKQLVPEANRWREPPDKTSLISAQTRAGQDELEREEEYHLPQLAMRKRFPANITPHTGGKTPAYSAGARMEPDPPRRHNPVRTL